jgi:hypothetical protein
MPAQANARVAPRVNINPASEVLQVSEGRARDLALATILWWNLRGHRASAAAASTEGRPLLAPQSCLLQVTLSAIGLRAVPPALSVSPLPALHKLDLSFNRIEWLADSQGGLAWLVTGLPHIEELNLTNNRLGRVPAELGELTSLKVLRLGSNGLRSLPTELSQLTELRELYLHANLLAGNGACFEQILPAMPQLEVLDINHNQMDTLPDALLQCGNLLKLNADNNSLVALPYAAGEGDDAAAADESAAQVMGQCLPKLQRLYLANNEFKSAPILGAQLAHWLPSLRVCDVSNNYGDPNDALNIKQILLARPKAEPHLVLEPEPELELEPDSELGSTLAGGSRGAHSVDSLEGEGARQTHNRCNVIAVPTLIHRETGAATSMSKLPPHPGPSGSTISSPPIPKLCRDLVRAERYVEALEALSASFFRGFTEEYIVKFDVQPVLRRRGIESEGYLAALTGRRGRTAAGQWQYSVTFKAGTLVRTSFAGLVRQLGHEFQHVRQFEDGIFDFARQEFLAYGWMLEGTGTEQGETENQARAWGSSSADIGGGGDESEALPPLSQEEQLTIAGQVHEFWRMLPPSTKSDPDYVAVHARAAAVRTRCGAGAGQQPLSLGQLLGAIDPSVAEQAARTIQAGWRRRQRRQQRGAQGSQQMDLATPSKGVRVLSRGGSSISASASSVGQACQLAFGSCGCGISRRFIY